MYSDRISLNGAGSKKRSVKDRLGTNAWNCEERSRSYKRFQSSDGKWQHDMFDDTDETLPRGKGVSQPCFRDEKIEDLRFKLQKKVSRGAQRGKNDAFGGIGDLREKLSGPLPPPGAPSQAVSMPHPGHSSVVRAARSSAARAPAAPAGKSSAQVAKRQVPPAKPPMPTLKPVNASKGSIGAAGMNIASFLQSLDLHKYLIHFQAEEVDMSVLRLMQDDELKDMGIPLGPRKRISSALAAQSKY